MSACIFCQIAKGKVPCHKVWEDDLHLAFLSIFPNTEGVTVVIPKKHYPSYAFDLPDAVLTRLILAAKTVALKIDNAFEDVGRTALVFEGFKVDHVYAKLFPKRGTFDAPPRKRLVPADPCLQRSTAVRLRTQGGRPHLKLIY